MQNLFLGRSEIFRTSKYLVISRSSSTATTNIPKIDIFLPDCKLHVIFQISVYIQFCNSNQFILAHLPPLNV